jgi:hypothetical protein
VSAGLTITTAGALLAGLVVAAPTLADPASYGSNGVFGVGDKPADGWATASIPPGLRARSAAALRRNPRR